MKILIPALIFFLLIHYRIKIDISRAGIIIWYGNKKRKFIKII